ncbi:CPBP family intramembrane glutamic endopeptidase [Slackia heliotrinireducens]|uniref:CAAX amino terminal protease family n=1 Tax=Slackia heliotrinireducens (strain ATCC 29202 / DSM 20476 / NCTC 11029 / RHS 1) TaxID=471855 RepID=C7N100_SLAHD|nr:CPBP family intramembrane glutamic endopeptidase [Slackia heliotrinireducens]ACV23222.1 CAAX amino terminal protease family [Slackia heliotrinireducens DSM 20476]
MRKMDYEQQKGVLAVLLWPLLYISGMGLSNYIVYHGYHIEYGGDGYANAMLPFLAVLAAGALICLFAQRERLALPWKERGRLSLFLIVFLPLAAMALYFLLTNGSFTNAFMAPLAAMLLVGVAEETMFRRILFIRLLGLFQGQSFTKPLLISAACFSLLHAVNIFGGLPAPQVLMQIAATFVAGLFYVLMFDYTRNIHLLIVMHFLWDYILFSGATQQIPVYAILMGLLQVAEVIIMLLLLAGKWGQNVAAERT